MNPLMVNGRGEGWPWSVQFLVQLVWILNPELVSDSSGGQLVLDSSVVGRNSVCRKWHPCSLGLYMDVFVAACFYPPDLSFVMAPGRYEIKRCSCLVYVPVCFLVRSSLWLLPKSHLLCFLVLQSLTICLLLWLFLSVNLWLYKDCDPKISCDRIFSCIKIDKKRGITEKRIWVVDIFDACPSSALGPWCLHSSKLTCTDLCKIYSGAVSTVLGLLIMLLWWIWTKGAQ